MPEKKITKGMVLEAAFGIVRSKGEASLSARSIAELAGCSVQPIYSLFGDMEGLMRELYEYARQWVKGYNIEHAGDGGNVFESNGLSHLRLAQAERPLFHFLYLSPHMGAHSIDEMYRSVSQEGVEECIQELGGLPAAEAHELYLNMIIYTHGLAAMLATGAAFSPEELSERIQAAFRGFLSNVR